MSRDLASLLQEGHAIQAHLTVICPTNNTHNLFRKFNKLVFVGNVKAPIRLLSDNECSGIHSLDTKIDNQSVKDILLEKHFPTQPIHLSTIVTSHTSPVFHSVLFDSISPELIRSLTVKINGSSGLSGVDAAPWKKLCTSFQSSSADLCSVLASLTRQICTSYIDPAGLHPLFASRLIATDKLLGVRLIEVGKIIHGIIGKAVLQVVGHDVVEVTGCDQFCAGQTRGCKAEVHAVWHLFESMDYEALLLANARNTFNSLNRHASLLNIRQSQSIPGNNSN